MFSNLSIRISNRTETTQLRTFPYRLSTPSLKHEVNGLTWTHKMPGGPATLTFQVSRDILYHWKDLVPGNVIKIYNGPTWCWEGEIEGIERDLADEQTYHVNCVGFCNRMKILGTDADHALNLGAGDKGSDWFTTIMLADTDLGFTAGTIVTDDFAITTGLEFYPGKSYWDIAEEIRKFDDCIWYLGEGKTFNFVHRETSPTYFVKLREASSANVDLNRDGLYNWCQFAYSPTGSIYGYVTSEDTDSQGRHGVRRYWGSVSGKCSQTEAQQIADTFIAESKLLKPSSSITTDIVRNIRGVIYQPVELQSRFIVSIKDLMATQLNIADRDTLNEVCSWEVAEVKVDADKNNVSLSPGDEAGTLDAILARIENRGKVL